MTNNNNNKKDDIVTIYFFAPVLTTKRRGAANQTAYVRPTLIPLAERLGRVWPPLCIPSLISSIRSAGAAEIAH